LVACCLPSFACFEVVDIAPEAAFDVPVALGAFAQARPVFSCCLNFLWPLVLME